MFDIKRVALYEEPGGGLIIHREGSPLAFVLEECAPPSFAADAAQLAEGKPESEWRPGRGRRVTVRDLKKLAGPAPAGPRRRDRGPRLCPDQLDWTSGRAVRVLRLGHLAGRAGVRSIPAHHTSGR
jgi:hypothetical protein